MKKDTRYTKRECPDCKRVKLYHDLSPHCKECRSRKRRREAANKYVHKYTENRVPILCIKTVGEAIVAEGSTTKELIANLRKKGLHISDGSVCKGTSRKALLPSGKEITYWHTHGLFFMYKEDYSKENILRVIQHHIDSRATAWRKPKPRKYDEDFKDRIMEIFNAPGKNKDIADKYGVKISRVSHIKTGRSYSSITGKVYEKQYNTYDSSGNLISIGAKHR